MFFHNTAPEKYIGRNSERVNQFAASFFLFGLNHNVFDQERFDFGVVDE